MLADNRFSLVVLAGSVALGNGLITGGALAAVSSEDTGRLEEIVVTAQKRTDKLSEVPVAVTALSADSLQSAGALTIRDITATVPGVHVSYGLGSGSFTMRGLTAGNDVNPTVGVQIDGAPIGPVAFAAGGASYVPEMDPSIISRIEVLRGPQGTLYGSSTLGGIVNYVTRTPSYNSTHGSLYGEVADTSSGDVSYVLRGTLETPLVTDRVALQLSGYTNQIGGFADAPAAGKKDFNNHDSSGGRLALAGQITPDLDFELSDIYSDLRSNSDYATYSVPTQKPLASDLVYDQPVLPRYDNKANIVLAKGNFRMPWATLSYVGSWQQIDSVNVVDFGHSRISAILNYFAPAFGGLVLPDPPNIGADAEMHAHKTTQELRLTSPDQGSLKWTVGVFYSDEDTKAPESIASYHAGGGPQAAPYDNLIYYNLITNYKEFAGFGDLTYSITSALDVTGGVRVQHISQDYRQLYGGTDGDALNAIYEYLGYLATPADSGLSKASDTVETYLANVRYKFSANNMVYFRYATGFRPGGPNVIVPGLPTSFGPDKSDDYELGWKMTTDSGRVYIDFDIYQVTWKDMQVLTFADGVNGQINGGRARSRGAELSANYRPIDGLMLAGTLAYSNAHLLEDLPTGLGKNGDTMPMNPTWSGSLSAEYQWHAVADWLGFAGILGHYVGQRYYTFEHNQVYHPYVLPSYASEDLRLGLRNDQFEVALFCRNCSDARGQLAASGLGWTAQPAVGTEVVVERPRTVGLSVLWHF